MAIYTVDLDGRIRSWNPAAERLFGWTAAEAIGELIPFLPEESVEGAVDGLRAQLDGESYRGRRLHADAQDGTTIHVITSASLLRDDDGQPA